MKVLLVYPNNPQVATQPPLGLMYIASVLKEHGHTPKIIEGDFEAVKRQFENLSIADFPDFIGITCMTSQYHEIVKMRDYFHQWDIPLIYGGPHATILPNSLLTKKEHFIDFVVVGEGEKTVLKIMDDLYNNRVQPLEDQIVQGEVIENLDSLPFPSRDLVDKRYLRHSVSILASRGCPFNCSFCQPTLRKIFGNKVRRRSVANVIAEIKECKEKFGIRDFEFFDDTFTSDKEWVYTFCDYIEHCNVRWRVLSRVDMLDFNLLKRMKETGLKKLSLGIETGNQQILNSYSKGTTVEQNHQVLEWCKKLDIKVHGFFMVGALDETLETIQETWHFIKEHEFDTIFVTVTMPMPCTRLYEEAEKLGKLNGDWRNFDYLANMTTTGGHSNPKTSIPMKLDGLSSEEIVEARYNLLRSFYMRKIKNPIYLLQFIWQNGWRYTWSATKNILGA